MNPLDAVLLFMGAIGMAAILGVFSATCLLCAAILDWISHD